MGSNYTNKTAYFKISKENSTKKVRRMYEDIQTTECKGSKTILEVWKQKENKRKDRWLNNMKKITRSQRIHLESLRAPLKKVPN